MLVQTDILRLLETFETSNNAITEVKNRANALTVKTNLETTRRTNNDPSVNRNVQTYKGEDKTVKFEERKVLNLLPEYADYKAKTGFFYPRLIAFLYNKWGLLKPLKPKYPNYFRYFSSIHI